MSGTLTNEEQCLQLWLYLTLWLHPRGSLKKHSGMKHVITFKIYIDSHADAQERERERMHICDERPRERSVLSPPFPLINTAHMEDSAARTSYGIF